MRLSSTAIENTQAHCWNEPGMMVAYWYFTFTDTEKQKVSNFLCSLITDICCNRRDTPTVLQEEYAKLNNGQQQPGTESLMRMLKAVIDGFLGIYIFVDALDECPTTNNERRKLLSVIQEIHSWKINSVHLLATSRKEGDILQAFDHIPSDMVKTSVISVQGTLVELDIEKFLEERLKDDKLRNWKSDLKQDVQNTLSSQADGM
jgi:hypothetical protein